MEAPLQSVEESVVNALVAARTMTGADYWTVSALPHDQLQEVLRRHGMLVSAGAQPEAVPKKRQRREAMFIGIGWCC